MFFTPICQVGCASASATRRVVHLARACASQNGPPDAVSTIARDALARLAVQALKDRASARCRPAAASRRCARVRDEQLARGDDQFFVRDRDVDAAIDRGEDRVERDRAVGRGEHDVGAALARDGVQTRARRRAASATSSRGPNARDLIGEQLRRCGPRRARRPRSGRDGARSRRAPAARCCRCCPRIATRLAASRRHQLVVRDHADQVQREVERDRRRRCTSRSGRARRRGRRSASPRLSPRASRLSALSTRSPACAASEVIAATISPCHHATCTPRHQRDRGAGEQRGGESADRAFDRLLRREAGELVPAERACRPASRRCR